MTFLSKLFGGAAGADRIDGARARELVADGAHLVDVRSPGEFAGGHIQGAVNVPVDRIATLTDHVPLDATVVVHCASGMRSARAVGLLKKAGYDKVFDLGAGSRW
jgi:phage shock protein E